MDADLLAMRKRKKHQEESLKPEGLRIFNHGFHGLHGLNGLENTGKKA